MAIKLIVAPLQGFTEAVWRHYHAEIAGGADEYYLPFIRMEHGCVRQKDIRDLKSPLNADIITIPQIIFRDVKEFQILTNQVTDAGYNRIDLNLGCPFPPQVKKGRGAGMILRQEILGQVIECIKEMPSIEFSVKMRLGVNNPQNWKGIITLLNSIKLSCITVHPRTAAQQYSGDINWLEFNKFLCESENPVIYNGDILHPQQIAEITEQYKSLRGVMVGRGLLRTPTLFAEFLSGNELRHDERMDVLKKIHDRIISNYKETLCGESQILSKIKPYWEYLENEIGHRNWKMIKKSPTLEKYEKAVDAILYLNKV